MLYFSQLLANEIFVLGVVLSKLIQSAHDLEKIGLKPLQAQALLNLIAEWKVAGFRLELHDGIERLVPVVAVTSGLQETGIALLLSRTRYIVWRICWLLMASGSLLVLGCCYPDEFAIVAVKCFQIAAATGYAPAQTNYGNGLLDGIGVAKDEKKAVTYFRLAANQGYAHAQDYLGVCYYNGQGVTKDEKEAARYFRLAADQGFANAQCNLGCHYSYGRGVIYDNQEAVRYFRMAADQGLARAQYILGLYSANGWDYRESVRFMELAAEQGHTDALHYLGVCYKNGYVVTKSNDTAMVYFERAAALGHEDSKKMLQQLTKK